MGEAGATSLQVLLSRIAGRLWPGAAVLLLLTFWAHAPSLQNGFIWDDPDWVIHNVELRTPAGLYRIWTDPRATPQYYPLVHTSFWIEYQLWGLTPFHFHLFNLLLHACAALLLWRCLRLLAIPGAYVAACVFALHPVQVESVAWVTERKNVLCAVFYFAAALYLLPVLLADELPSQRPWRGRYAAGLALFLAAMLSKTVACALGPALLVLVWWKNGSVRRRHLALVAPLIALGAGLGLLTAWLERAQVGAAGREWSFSFADRWIIAGRSLAFYLQGLVWPGERVFVPPRWQIDAGEPAQYLYPAAAVLVIAALFVLRAKIGRGPLAAALIFVGTLFPALGFFNLYPMRYAFAFDHFQYLACAAPIALACAGGARLLGRQSAALQSLGGLGCVLLLAAYGALSWRQSHVYFDEETLWRHTLRLNPDSWLANHSMANALLQRQQLDQALVHARRAEAEANTQEAHNTLGSVLAARGDAEGAIAEFRRAIALAPRAGQGYLNLGTALYAAGRMRPAEAALRIAVQLTPVNPLAHNNLANAAMANGNAPAALQHYQRAVELGPEVAVYHAGYGAALHAAGRIEPAIAQLEAALALDPSLKPVRNNLGVALVLRGDMHAAETQFRHVLELDPSDATARANLDRLRQLAGH